MEESFNHDGFWKAFFVSPEGRLRSEPVIAIVAQIEPAPPQFFVWDHDSARDVAEVPGFVAVMGTMDPPDACEEFVRRNSGDKIEAWSEFYRRSRL
jgi:hypothetical protein